MPKYEPHRWNHPNVVGRNHCYNYALDRLNNIHRNPGLAAGLILPPQQVGLGAIVAQYAIHDGLIPIVTVLPYPYINRSLIQSPDHWPVALFTSGPGPGIPNGDYHWYRRDDGGYWSHKPGIKDPATNLDDNGNDILEPTKCARGTYQAFVGYFLVIPRYLKGP